MPNAFSSFGARRESSQRASHKDAADNDTGTKKKSYRFGRGPFKTKSANTTSSADQAATKIMRKLKFNGQRKCALPCRTAVGAFSDAVISFLNFAVQVHKTRMAMALARLHQTPLLRYHPAIPQMPRATISRTRDRLPVVWRVSKRLRQRQMLKDELHRRMKE